MTFSCFRLSTSRVAIAASMLFAATPAALADFTAEDVYDALTATAIQSGAEISTGNIAMDGADTVVLEQVQLGDGGDAVTIDRVELRDITEPSDGEFVIGEVYIPAGDYDGEDGFVVSIGETTVSDLHATANPDADLTNGYYSRLTMGPLAVSKDGGTLVSAEAINSTVTPYDKGQPVAGSLTIDRLIVDVTQIDDADTQEAMTALGYTTLESDVIANSAWNPQTGEVSISEMTISTKDAADLTLSMTLGGYTQEVAEAIRDLQSQMTDENEQAMGMAMLGMFQQMEVQAIRVHLKDESLTGRVLDFIGAQQGMNRESVAAMAKGMMPIFMSQLQAPEFAAQAQAAISAYLDDPDTLTITAEPESPVPFAVLMGSAMGGAPAALIQALNVQISANQ